MYCTVFAAAHFGLAGRGGFPTPTPPFDNPRTAAGPEILFLSVSTSFETTLAGLRQMGDHQPWEGGWVVGGLCIWPLEPDPRRALTSTGLPCVDRTIFSTRSCSLPPAVRGRVGGWVWWENPQPSVQTRQMSPICHPHTYRH